MMTEHSITDDTEIEHVDLERRFLCADGSCIGVIGDNGHCKTCGTAIDPTDVEAFEHTTSTTLGAEFERHSASPPAQTSPDADMLDEDETDESPEVPDLAQRRLCSDGTCIGVIGSDDLCKECGKPYSGEES